MGKIDKGLALDMMRGGDNDTKIGERFGTSRQAANLLRKAFVKEGKLTIEPKGQSFDNEPIKRKTKNEQSVIPARDPGMTTPQFSNYPTFEQLTAWMIRIIKEAGEVQQLRRRCEVAESETEVLQTKVRDLQQSLSEMTQQYAGILLRAKEYEQAIRQLGLPPAQG